MTQPLPADPIMPPEWWLLHLVRDLLYRQNEYTRRAAYVEGRHSIPQGDKRYMRALSKLQRLAPTNYIGLVTTAPVQRMSVRGFKFGKGDGPDPDAARIWVANDMDFQSASVHNAAAKFGLAYTLVSPPGPDDNGIPVITYEDPRTTIVYRDPARPTRNLAGLRMWTDDFEGKVVAVLYLPDRSYLYFGPDEAHIENMSVNQLINTLTGITAGASAFELVATFPNETGLIPITEYVWRPESGLMPEGEAGRDVCCIQDRINATILDRIVISRTQAYKQRYATGVSKPTKGKKNPDWDPGSDMVWITEKENAKFGEFTSADIRQILEAIRDDVSDIAAITQTPAHYLMGKIANISGETLAQAETGLVKKTKQRMKSMGWAHERTMKIAFAFMNDPRATEVDAEVLWEDPEQNALVDLASSAAQLAAAKIPVQLVMEKLGFSSEQIEFAVKENQRMLEQQQNMQLKTMKAQAALAPKQGPPGQGGSTPKPKQSSPNNTKKKPPTSASGTSGRGK